MSGINFSKKEWIDLVFENRNKSYGAYELRAESGKIMLKALFLGVLLLMSFVSIPMIANHFDKNKEMIIPEPYERVLPPVTYITDLPKPKPDLPEKQATQVSAVDVKKDVAATITENTTTDEEMLSRDEVKGLVTGNVDVEGQEGGSYMATSPGNENVTDSDEGNPNGVEDGQNILKTMDVAKNGRT